MTRMCSISPQPYKLDDYRPISINLWMEEKLENICGNYPENEISRVIREDPKILVYYLSDRKPGFSSVQRWSKLEPFGRKFPCGSCL